MKFLTTFPFLLTIGLNLFGQKNEIAEPFQRDKDTAYVMVDQNGKMQNLPGMPFIRKYWPENGKYREIHYKAKEGNVVRAAWYKDKDFKEKDGSWEEYHDNGMPKDSGQYVNNLKQGTFRGWYVNGVEHHILHYDKGLPIDTGYVFRENGELSQLIIADATGNGIEQNYHENGKVKMLGRIKEGKRNGPWTLKREDGTKMMTISYMLDSISQTTCFETDGITQAKGECIFEREAAFPNGAKGLQEFLRNNMRYPDAALDRKIQGIVNIQFTIYTDGTIGDFMILSSPDKILSDEVLRFMKKSPKWLPAIENNQPVIYKKVQAVTFRLN